MTEALKVVFFFMAKNYTIYLKQIPRGGVHYHDMHLSNV